MRRLRVGMAQINTTVGDFPGNAGKILETVEKARKLGVDLLTFPEMAVCGYPPEDLLFKPHFIKENRRTLDKIARKCGGIIVAVGFVGGGTPEDRDIHNSLALIHDGKILDIYHKILLPNYGVFDEERYFEPGKESPVYSIGGISFGFNVCEDIWLEEGPAKVQCLAGAEVIINISASPYHFDKSSYRKNMLTERAAQNKAIIIYNNLVGGQDELVFDGNSLIISETGALIAHGHQFREDLIIADIDVDSVRQARSDDKRWAVETPPAKLTVELPETADKSPLPERQTELLSPPGEVYEALVLGTRDYILKNGFKKVVIGLSGGIDSTLVATIAADALGAENVTGVSMPSRYSSEGSKTDAELLAKNLGIKLLQIPIEKTFQAYMDTLSEALAGTQPDLTEENLQARIRGNILMALSNKFGWIVLTTGNKSEMATGYSTLYGDMAGGFAVIKDVPKTLVYSVCRYRNEKAGWDIIPASTIEKPPSAELRPDQKDTDSLPPYEIMDPVLTAYVEEDKSIEEIIAMGFERDVVVKTARLVDVSEYKRRQAPPGIKITPRAFGRDRRLPITNRFRDSTHLPREAE